MKSFSQFLQESYLNEEIPAGMTRAQYNALPAQSRRRLGGSNAALGRQGQPLQGGASAPAIRSARQGMSAPAAATVAGTTAAGAAATLAANRGDNPAKPRLDDRLDSDIKTTKVKSPARKPGDPWNQFPKNRQPQLGIPKEGPSSQLPGRTLEPAGGTTPRPALPEKGQTQRSGALATRSTSTSTITTPKPTTSLSIPQTSVKVDDVTNPRRAAADNKLRRAAAGTGPSGKPIITPPPSEGKPSTPSPSGGKQPAGPKPTAKLSKLGKFGKALGPAAAALDTALSTADERAKGSGWVRSLAKGATVAAGGLAGGALGALGGGGIGSAALGAGGAVLGSQAAGKAFDVAAGANAKERKAMATANRQRQAGTAIKGIGGKTTFDTKKNTMTTGTGSQRKTVQLAKTGVVQRGGQSVAGHLAYKDGKAVYKAGPSAQSLAKTSSNPLERIGRTLIPRAYERHDARKAQQALTQARQSDAARNKALGVKALPGK